MAPVRVRSSPSQQTEPATSAGFRFLPKNCDKTVPRKFHDYRPPKLVKGVRWYVEYYYRVPPELIPIYNKEWQRFKVNEDVNRYRDEGYAKDLLDAVSRALEKGYNPFKGEQIQLAMEGGSENKEIITIKDGLIFFSEKYKKRGLEESTLQRYEYAVELIRKYLADKGLLKQPLSKVHKLHIENLLETNKEERKWSNRQFNNMKGFIFTVFEFLRKKELIPKNPVEFIESLKSKTRKHKYYDKKLFPKITSIIKSDNPYLWYAVQFVYYLCVRSEKELAALKVGDIIDEGEYFLFRAEAVKSDRDDLIPIDPNLREVMEEMGLFKAPKDYYIFTSSFKPGPVPFGKNFFARRFREIRKTAGLSQDFTLYGFRHTRATHLVKDGLKVSDLMVLLRHRDISATLNYLKSLGIDFDKTDLLKKGRKI